ncbi:MAG: hydrogenase maturation peptidase HycI [Promethearchaeota archaeon]
MTSWKSRLSPAFSQASKVAILGIGNDLKADDGIGPYVIDQLQHRTPSHVELINASTVPENFLSHLIDSHPDLILIIDAALMQTEPGTIQLIDKHTIGGIAFSSHSLPLTFFIEYLENNITTTILILGIQPLTDEFAQPLSEPVQQAANEIIATLSNLFTQTL